ncbi:ABC transporter permease [Saccharomonospora viridis]|uniref:ABC-type multidrug transport system, permease component n=2 Tax=Saccharomonospora viridis TaxID=1852 RepID=C7MX27_SACVD|nr:ABC transporter permease [Saccharomonospora viridis]ACU97944.1 ABC-type multidrug transport system, permease component [Saccharomonospora viridis DSM 43017]KHF45911.1 multidrug ABC transporter permease [Saccharomonospora viridis]SFP39624.1 ABC-2 type transport system permease protein [Saccharomonospora viridis]
MRPRPITALVVANLQRQVRDRVGLFFMVVMPFVTILFVGLAMGGTSGDDELPIAVYTQDGDRVGAAVVAELERSGNVALEHADSVEELRERVSRGTVAAGLVVTPGDEELDLVLAQTNGTTLAARSQIDAAVGKVAAVMEAERAAMKAGATAGEAARYVREAQAVTSATVDVRGESDGDATPSGFAYTAPANLLLFTFINSMAVAAALVESKRLGMIRRSVAAPVSGGRILLGEAVSRFAVALAQSLLIIVVSALLFGVEWGDPFGVAVVVGVFCLVATGAAMLVGAFVRSPQQAPAIGPPLGIVLGMLGGCLWPREVAGEPLNTIGYLFPHAWGMDALLTLTQPGAGIADVWTEVAVIGGMAVVVLGVALAVFRRRAVLVT